MHKNDHSPPPAAFVRAYAIRPYIIGMSENKRSPAGGTGDLLELPNDLQSIAVVLLDVGIGVDLALGDGQDDHIERAIVLHVRGVVAGATDRALLDVFTFDRESITHYIIHAMSFCN